MAEDKKQIPPSSLIPPSFGPGSWRGTPEKLVDLYSTLRKTEEKTEQEPEKPIEAASPLPIEEENIAAFYPRAIALTFGK